MRHATLVGTMLLLLLVPSVPEQSEIALGDFGTITFVGHRPDAARTAALIELLFAQFPSVDVPPTHIEILSYKDFEERLARVAAGELGQWRAWLRNFQKQTDWMYSAYSVEEDADNGRLHIVTFQELDDQLLIHECMHVIASWLEVKTDDRPLLNTERQVQDDTSAFITSLRYRKFLRDEPWS